MTIFGFMNPAARSIKHLLFLNIIF